MVLERLAGVLLSHSMNSLSSGYLISSALIWLEGAPVPDRKLSGGGSNGMFIGSLYRCGWGVGGGAKC